MYKNSNWLEREVAEMHGVEFTNKKDSRRLLLDYTTFENPLLKKFPCEGLNFLKYNPLISEIQKINYSTTEL